MVKREVTQGMGWTPEKLAKRDAERQKRLTPQQAKLLEAFERGERVHLPSLPQSKRSSTSKMLGRLHFRGYWCWGKGCYLRILTDEGRKALEDWRRRRRG